MLLEAVVGIVTGILTTVVLYLTKVIWDHAVHPFLRQVRYSGIDVSGRWFGTQTDESGTSSEFDLILEQKAHDVSGTFQLQFVSEENSFDLSFKVSGQIWEGYITLNFKPADRRVTSYATALLKVAGGGISLEGQMAFRNVNTERVDSQNVFLVRGSPAELRQISLLAKKKDQTAPAFDTEGA